MWYYEYVRGFGGRIGHRPVAAGGVSNAVYDDGPGCDDVSNYNSPD
jgi:hypothetical protein